MKNGRSDYQCDAAKTSSGASQIGAYPGGETIKSSRVQGLINQAGKLCAALCEIEERLSDSTNRLAGPCNQKTSGAGGLTDSPDSGSLGELDRIISRGMAIASEINETAERLDRL